VARRSFGSFRGRPAPARRISSWDLGPGGTGAQTQLSGSIVSIVNAAITPTEDGLTVVRIRGELSMYLSSADVAQSGFSGAFGIGKATAAAVLAGAASVPTPITEEGWDGWLYHRFFTMKAVAPLDGGASADLDGLSVPQCSRVIEVDTRAMRKLDIEDSVFAIVEVIEVGTSVFNWSFNSRMLLKLP